MNCFVVIKHFSWRNNVQCHSQITYWNKKKQEKNMIEKYFFISFIFRSNSFKFYSKCLQWKFFQNDNPQKNPSPSELKWFTIQCQENTAFQARIQVFKEGWTPLKMNFNYMDKIQKFTKRISPSSLQLKQKDVLVRKIFLIWGLETPENKLETLIKFLVANSYSSNFCTPSVCRSLTHSVTLCDTIWAGPGAQHDWKIFLKYFHD